MPRFWSSASRRNCAGLASMPAVASDARTGEVLDCHRPAVDEELEVVPAEIQNPLLRLVGHHDVDVHHLDVDALGELFRGDRRRRLLRRRARSVRPVRSENQGKQKQCRGSTGSTLRGMHLLPPSPRTAGSVRSLARSPTVASQILPGIASSTKAVDCRPEISSRTTTATRCSSGSQAHFDAVVPGALHRPRHLPLRARRSGRRRRSSRAPGRADPAPPAGPRTSRAAHCRRAGAPGSAAECDGDRHHLACRLLADSRARADASE